MRFCTIILIFLEFYAFAGTYTSQSNGDWSDDAIWSSPPGDNDCTPAGNHTYNINHYVSSSCSTLSFSGSVVINVATGATLYLSGSGGLTGNVTLNIATGGTVIVIGNLNLSGSSDVTVNGTLNVNGNIVGAGSTFDCNGTTNLGTVNIGGVGCVNCTNAGDAGCTQSVPLPVNLISFNVEAEGNDVHISWTTSYEKDNDHFILERSLNGIEFAAVFNVAGKIYSNTPENYLYDDENLSTGKYYYRLVQIDIDGTKTSTEAICAVIGGSFQFSVYPNPGEISQVKIDLTALDNFPVLIILMNTVGATLYSNVYCFEKNSEGLSIRELYTNIIPGIYYISASSNNVLIRKKLIVY